AGGGDPGGGGAGPHRLRRRAPVVRIADRGGRGRRVPPDGGPVPGGGNGEPGGAGRVDRPGGAGIGFGAHGRGERAVEVPESAVARFCRCCPVSWKSGVPRPFLSVPAGSVETGGLPSRAHLLFL